MYLVSSLKPNELEILLAHYTNNSSAINATSEWRLVFGLVSTDVMVTRNTVLSHLG